MQGTVRYEREGRIAEAVIDNPPVNATSHSVRSGLIEALKSFEADAEAEALVIRCEGKTFVAGADITEFGKPMAAPMLPDVLKAMDHVRKPLVAAVHGTALGGGFEVALAAHYRIATADAKFGFPEVKLGLIPGAGGTQRTPRLAGLETAIKLITEGSQIGTAQAKAAGLVDEIAEGDLREAARGYAERLVCEGKSARSAGSLPMPPDDAALFDMTRKNIARKMRGQTAPLLALDAIRLGYELSFEQALDREYLMCKGAVASPQSKALRHVFAAERAVARIPDLPSETPVRDVRKAAVVGLGQMGRGIVMTIASAGIPVIAIAKDATHADSARAAIAKLWSSAVAKGTMTQPAMDDCLARILWSTDIAAVAETDLVIEAVTEGLAWKQEVFGQLGENTGPGTILASNTSYLNIDLLAEASGRPADVAGMHFFNPAHVMRLLENVRTPKTHPEVVATIMAFGKRIGKLPVLSGVCDGFIVNRMLAKRSREGFFLIEEGASPAAIDKAVLDFGFPMGPFALSDLAGLDVQSAARAARRTSMSERELRVDFPEQHVAAGRLGQKSGTGWYSYDENRKASPNPATDAMISAHAARHGLALREIGDHEIVERLIYAMVNEGAKLIDEGIVSRPHEIDVAMINGLGFPSFSGGPMFWADQIGLSHVLERIEQFRADHGDEYWTPSPLLAERARQGKGFYN